MGSFLKYALHTHQHFIWTQNVVKEKPHRNLKRHWVPLPAFLFLRLAQADENYKTVQNEIKSSMCSLISEINKKGKMLLNQLEV